MAEERDMSDFPSVIVAVLQVLATGYDLSPDDVKDHVVKIAESWAKSENRARPTEWRHYETDGYTFDLRQDGNGGLQIGREPLE